MKHTALCIVFLAVAASFASASTIYNYTGSDFTNVSGPVGGATTSDSLSFTLIFANSLSPDTTYNGVQIENDLLSWSANDGNTFLSSSNPQDNFLEAYGVFLTTDDNGNILSWSLSMNQAAANPVPPNVFTIFISQSETPEDESLTYSAGAYATPAVAFTDPIGTWEAVRVATPEPRAFYLILLLMALIAVREIRHRAAMAS
jgi:hypothetical protein